MNVAMNIAYMLDDDKQRCTISASQVIYFFHIFP